MQRSNVLVIGAGLLLAASSPAFADGDGDGSASAGAGAEVSAGGATAGATGEVAAGGDAMGAWPMEMINQPYTLPASKLAVYGDLDVLRYSVTVGTTTSSGTAEGLHFGAGYGVNDKITVGGEYAFTLNKFEIKGPLTLYGEFKLAHTSKMSVAASADLTVDLNGVGAMGASSTTETLHAGLGLRYLLAPKIAVFTGAPIGPGPVGQHLSIGFQSGAPISFDIPAGVALQATPQIFAYLSTNLAHIKISNTANAFIGADFFPLTLGGYYTANKNLAVGAFLKLPDLKNSKFDVLVFGVAARWYN